MANVKNTNKKKMSKPALAAAIVSIAILLGLVVSLLASSGLFFRVKDGASSDNFEVNASMMEYYTQSYYSNWYSQNYYYILLGYISFDPQKSLTEQYTDSSKTQTYYDYFVEGAKTTVETYLKYCEAAKNDTAVFADIEADADQYVKDSMKTLRESAKSANTDLKTYIRSSFGQHVSVSDVKKALKIENIASSYYEIVYDRMLDAVDEAREDKYFAENLSSFVSAEYLIYTLSSSKTVTFPVAEDYEGGAESKAYKAAINGKTAEQIANAKIDPADYEGGAESAAYKKAYETAESNKKSNELSLATDKALIEKLAAAETADEFKKILLEEKYATTFSSAYSSATSKLEGDDKASDEIKNAYNSAELKKAIIDAVLAGEVDVAEDVVKIPEGAPEKWVEAVKGLTKTVVTNLNTVITNATKTGTYSLTTVLGNKLFGGVKAEFGVDYEKYEVTGTNAAAGDHWMANGLEMSVENAKLSLNITNGKIEALEEKIAAETDADKKAELEDEKKSLEDTVATLEANVKTAEDKLANVEKTSEYSFSAYFVTEAAHRDDYKLRDVGHILFKVDTTKETDSAVSYKTFEDAETAAKALLETIKGEAGLTKEKFEEFGKVTHDSNVFYEDVNKGDMVAEFEDWLFAAKEVGELGLVKTSYGWHIMYYGGESEDVAWRVSAEEGAAGEDMSDWFDALEYEVTINDEIFAEIFGVDADHDHDSHEGHNH